MIEPKCDICRTQLGLPLQQFHQIEAGFRCVDCYRDHAYNHYWFGWLFRWIGRRLAS